MTDTEKKETDEVIENTTEEQTEEVEAVEAEDEAEIEVPETEEEKNMREKAEYLDGWQRAQAEMVNLKKRHENDRKTFTTLGKESLLQDLIPMLDNFDAAFSNKNAWESVDANWRVGIEYIHAQFIQTLENNGVVAYGAEGDAFDASLHEPIESEGEGNIISRVMQKGYKIGDRVVRPAKVKLT